MTIWPRWFVGVALVVLLGCDMPRDPEGTLNRVRGEVLRVGISHNPPWTEVPPWTETADEEPGGLEPQLLKQLAAALSAEIQWTKDTEGDLIEALGRGDLDVVVCGMVESTAWSDQVGLTQPYLVRGGKAQVMAVRQGENAWLLELDRFLQSRNEEIRRMADDRMVR